MEKRKKGKEETVASDDVVEEINGGRAGGEPRNRVKRNETKGNERKRNEREADGDEDARRPTTNHEECK